MNTLVAIREEIKSAPNSADVLAAKAILKGDGSHEDGKRILRAKVEALRGFCAGKPDGAAVMDSKGHVRTEWIEAMLVHQARQKAAKRVVSKTIAKEEIVDETIHEWSLEQLWGKLGKFRTRLLLEMKPCPIDCYPCPYTASNDPYLMVYKVSMKKN